MHIVSRRRFEPTSTYPTEWGYPPCINGPSDAREHRK